MIYNSPFYDLFVSRISIHHVYIIHEVWEKNRPQALVGCENARKKVNAKSERQFERNFWRLINAVFFLAKIDR